MTPATAGAQDAGTYFYRAESGDLSQWEEGQGVYTTSGTTLSRATVYSSSTGGAKVSFTVPPQVAIVALAQGLREVLTASRTYYVSTTGNNANTGLASGAAFATMQFAVDFVRNNIDMAGFTVTIQVAAGTYTAGVSVTDGTPFSGGHCILQGDTTTPGNVIIAPSVATNACIQVTFETTLYVQGFKLAGGANVNYGFYCSGGGRINVSGNMEYGAISSTPSSGYPAGTHIGANSLGRVFLSASYSISAAAGAHFVCAHGGLIEVASALTVTITGTPAFATAFTYVVWSGIGNLGSITFSGAATGARYNVQFAGMIDTGAAGATYFPGNAAGTIGDVLGNRGNYF